MSSRFRLKEQTRRSGRHYRNDEETWIRLASRYGREVKMTTFFPDDRRGFKPMGLKSNPSEIREGSDIANRRQNPLPLETKKKKTNKQIPQQIYRYVCRTRADSNSLQVCFFHPTPPKASAFTPKCPTSENETRGGFGLRRKKKESPPTGFHDSEVQQERESCLDTTMLVIIKKKK